MYYNMWLGIPYKIEWKNYLRICPGRNTIIVHMWLKIHGTRPRSTGCIAITEGMFPEQAVTNFATPQECLQLQFEVTKKLSVSHVDWFDCKCVPCGSRTSSGVVGMAIFPPSTGDVPSRLHFSDTLPGIKRVCAERTKHVSNQQDFDGPGHWGRWLWVK